LSIEKLDKKMPAVPILIYGKTYNINCPDHEQERIKKLAEFVNEKISEVLPSCRSANEITILSFALLAIADEMFQIRHYVGQMEQKWQQAQKIIEQNHYSKASASAPPVVHQVMQTTIQPLVAPAASPHTRIMPDQASGQNSVVKNPDFFLEPDMQTMMKSLQETIQVLSKEIEKVSA
jgi:cell division protein ZapA